MYDDGLARCNAHFDSECDSCGSQITEGDLIARTPDGDFVCEDCFDTY